MRKHCAQLAQLVEQRTENPCVSGSIPELGILIYYGILAQVVEHLTFNQVVRGSNPRCLIKNASLKEAFFNVRHRRNRTPDNVVDRGVDRGKYVGIICIWIRIFCGYNINTGKVWYQKN